MKMKPIMIIKIIIDFTMIILMTFAMSYFLIPNMPHEIIGLSIFILFIVHNCLNWKWYKNIFKGKYGLVRIIQTIINLLLWIATIITIFSAMKISGHVFAFLGLSVTRDIRLLHLSSTMWMFILTAIHFGFHWQMFINIIKKTIITDQKKETIIKWVLRIINYCLCIGGLIEFFTRKLYEELFMLTEFKFFANGFLFEYLGAFTMVFILFTTVSYYIKKGLIKISKKANI